MISVEKKGKDEEEGEGMERKGKEIERDVTDSDREIGVILSGILDCIDM